MKEISTKASDAKSSDEGKVRKSKFEVIEVAKQSELDDVITSSLRMKEEKREGDIQAFPHYNCVCAGRLCRCCFVSGP